MSGDSKVIEKYNNQDFNTLKAQCLKEKTLFCDPTFPAAPESLGFKELGPNSVNVKGLVWKRPKEIISDPQFIVHGATRTDIRQGVLGDCWLMAAIASLTLDQDVLARVIHPSQSFTQDYAGIFHFQLWQYGQWVDVVIDDRLPTKKGKLMFVHSVDKNEFWSALLEKAYAKVNGSYEALSGGLTSEAFEDFTGGIPERYELDNIPPNLFSIMMRALSRGSLLSSSISGTKAEKESITEEQLVKTHAYSITGVEEVHVQGQLVQLVRLRNPWGYREWTGAWSDKSKEWDHVLPDEKAKLNHAADDGEFWMSYSDFIARYSNVQICNLTPDASSSDHASSWELRQFEGSWKVGSTAGGWSNAAQNPQFAVTVGQDGHNGHGKTNSCSVLVGLMQKNMRKERKLGRDLNNIGFSVYPVPNELKGKANIHLDADTLSRMRAIITSTYTNLREVCQRFVLPPGQYVIVPSTYEPNLEASFLLRVFSD